MNRLLARTLSITVCVIFFSHSLDKTSLMAESSERPNVLVILTDDQGWGDVSLHGNPNLQTPNIDSLARDGANLKNFYVCAVCSPTRAEFLTGRYHTRMGVYSTSSGGERFDLNERTIGDVFKSASYRTAAFGKWHSGMQPPYHPNARGFDEFYGYCSGHWGNYFSPMLEHNGQIVQGDGFLTNDLTSHAIDFMKEDREEPFFVYLPLNTPHSPMQVPDRDWKKFANKIIVPDPAPDNAKQEDVSHTRAALALCENIDDNVGRLLKFLEQSGKADDTIVAFFCDNGPNGARFNGGLRGRKGSVYEGGLRSPCLIRWPGKVQPGLEIDRISGAIDWLPTLAGLCDVSIGRTAGPLDGVSFSDRLLNAESRDRPMPSRLIYSAWNGQTSVRSQRFRYHVDGRLYDIETDPGEQTNVAAQHPAIAERMGNQLREWIKETKPRKASQASQEAFPVGDPNFAFTQLPARDATASGIIQRSSRHPNSSYFGEWTDPADSIQWDVDVLKEGRFDVEMRYVTPTPNTATTVRLAFVGQDANETDAITADVVATADAEIVGRQFDRSPRTEGYEKNWSMMKLGRIELPKGKGVLRMTASQSGAGAATRGFLEMRLILLNRVTDHSDD